ncbi:DUF3592 domain-containing protein [Megalodesulfovibrio paquesii]
MPTPSRTPPSRPTSRSASRQPLPRPPRDFRLYGVAMAIARLLPFMLMLPVLVLAVAGMFFSPSLREAAPALLAVAAILLPLSLWLQRLTKSMRDGQQEAAIRFTTASPRACLLENLRYADMGGQAFLVLDADARKPLFPAMMRFSRRVWNLPATEEVDLFLDSSGVSPIFALAARNVSGWGERLTRATLDTGWRQTRRLFFWLGALFIFGLIVLSVLLIREYQSLQQTRAWAEESLSWPAVPATIHSSHVEETRISSGKRTVKGWKAVVEYQYVMDEISYPGQRIRYGYAAEPSPDEAEAIVARYPAGATAEVRVDPRMPARSVLEPGHVAPLAHELATLRLVGFGGCGAILLLMGIPAGVLAYYSKRRRQLIARLEEAGMLARQ